MGLHYTFLIFFNTAREPENSCIINHVVYFGLNKKQFIGYNVNSKSTLLNIVYGVLKGSILGHLLFLLYINDLPQASKLLDPIMFADDTNLFYLGKDIHSLFNTVNNEL